MTDYWLSKLFFDMQKPGMSAEYRAGREAVLDRYQIAPEIRRALLADDIETLAPRVNPYLLRFYFAAVGMPDDVFIGRLRKLESAGAAPSGNAHG